MERKSIWEAFVAPQVLRALSARQDLLVPPALKARQDLLAQLVIKVLLVLQEQPGLPAHKDPREFKVRQEQQALKVRRALRDLRRSNSELPAPIKAGF